MCDLGKVISHRTVMSLWLVSPSQGRQGSHISGPRSEPSPPTQPRAPPTGFPTNPCCRRTGRWDLSRLTPLTGTHGLGIPGLPKSSHCQNAKLLDRGHNPGTVTWDSGKCNGLRESREARSIYGAPMGTDPFLSEFLHSNHENDIPLQKRQLN